MSTTLIPLLDGRESVRRPSNPPSSDLRARVRELEASLAGKERELSESRLSERRYRAVARHLPNAFVALFDHDLRYVLAEGHAALEAVGVVPAEVVGRTVYEVSTPQNVEAMARQYRMALAGHASTFELYRDGRTLSMHATPVRDESGEVVLGMLTAYDVTSFRAAEAALRQQTQLVGLLQAVTFAANAAYSSTEAMQVCLEEVCTYMRWPIGHAYRREGDALVSSNIWHFGDSLWDTEAGTIDVGPFVKATRHSRVKRGSGFVAAVFESGRSLSLTAFDGFGRAEAARAVGIQGGFALPVLVGSEVAAVLEFYTLSAEVPDANALEVLANVGTQIGRVIERERAHAALEAHAAAVRAMSVRDELTGLENRRGFMSRAAEQLALAESGGRPAALFFADLNGMKPINDLLGHDEGDRALVDIANVWRKVFRSTDVLARLGGDEFVMFAAGVDAATVDVVRARIAAEVAAFNALDARPYALSVSVGAAAFDPVAPRSLEDLLAAADAAMYEEKRKRAPDAAPR